MKKIKSGKPHNFLDPVWTGISKEAKELINQLLDRDETTRLSAEGALNHNWIKNHYKQTFDKKVAEGALENLSTFRFKPNTKLSQAFYAFIVN